MNKETLRMQMLAGVITESQYKEKLNEMGNESSELNPLISKLKSELGPEVTVKLHQFEDEDIDGNMVNREKIDIYATEDGFDGDGVFEIDRHDGDQFHVYYLDFDQDEYFDKEEDVIQFIKDEINKL